MNPENITEGMECEVYTGSGQWSRGEVVRCRPDLVYEVDWITRDGPVMVYCQAADIRPRKEKP